MRTSLSKYSVRVQKGMKCPLCAKDVVEVTIQMYTKYVRVFWLVPISQTRRDVLKHEDGTSCKVFVGDSVDQRVVVYE